MRPNMNNRERLRQRRKELQRKKTLTFILVSLAAVGLIASAVFLPNILSGRSTHAYLEGFTMGDPDAPVKVTNFSSYACGFCGEFSENVEPGFIEQYVETGDVYYRYVNIPGNDGPSLLAAEASYCAADQQGFFNYKRFLYANVRMIDGFSEENLLAYAGTSGLDVDIFQACMADNTYTNAYRQDIRYAQSVGVTATPVFLVNDQLVFSSDLINLVDSLLARVEN